MHWAALGAGACGVGCGDRRGSAGQHVEWLDDGTVLLKLGPAYDNAVIETAGDELGTAVRAATTPPFTGPRSAS